ncbi:MAG: hypothetical protein BWZ03_00306 [bacterium ADurb.BinA186]|nr:MAG: hypothetical protein BWZ03_00306 [bacterium ADurb.BinA186]
MKEDFCLIKTQFFIGIKAQFHLAADKGTNHFYALYIIGASAIYLYF